MVKLTKTDLKNLLEMATAAILVEAELREHCTAKHGYDHKKMDRTVRRWHTTVEKLVQMIEEKRDSKPQK